MKIGSGDPTTTYYVVDKNRDYAQVLEERDANGTLAVRYVYGLDLIAQVRGTNPGKTKGISPIFYTNRVPC